MTKSNSPQPTAHGSPVYCSSPMFNHGDKWEQHAIRDGPQKRPVPYVPIVRRHRGREGDGACSTTRCSRGRRSPST